MVILVKFVPSGSLSLDFPLVFIKDKEEKKKEMFILLKLRYERLSLKESVGVCLCFLRQGQLKIYHVLC